MSIKKWWEKLTGSAPSISMTSKPPPPSGGLEEKIVWLERRIDKHGPPPSLKDLQEADIIPHLDRLLEAGGMLRSGQRMIFGMALSEEELLSASERITEPLASAINLWVDLLEQTHGETGLSFAAERAQQMGYPLGRGTPRLGRRRNTLNPAPETAEELEGVLAEATQQEYVELDESADGFVEARIFSDWDGPDTGEVLSALLKQPGAAVLRKLTIGLWTADGENAYHEAIQILKEAAPAQLEELFIGDFEYPDETEISWTDVGNLAPLWAALPNLRRLRVRGGGIKTGRIRHPKLQSLTFESGGLPGATVRAIAKIECPELEHLELWFGDFNYGAEGDIEMLRPLFSNPKLTKLKHLGLRNADFTNDIAAEVPGAVFAGQLETLDLSLGTLANAGAKALAERAAKLTSLQKLDIDENFVEEEGKAALRAAFGDKLHVGHQDEPDGDGEEVWFYVSVGE